MLSRMCGCQEPAPSYGLTYSATGATMPSRIKRWRPKLGRSEITIKGHRGKVMQKMEKGSLADLVRMTARLTFIPAPKG